MGTVVIGAKTALDWVVALPASHETFCAYLACGYEAREAAAKAGYTELYGGGLVQRPDIINRVTELSRIAQPGDGVVSRLWIELQFLDIAKEALSEQEEEIDPVTKACVQPQKSKDLALARGVLMDICKLRGYIVERKVERKERIDYGKVSQDTLTGLLADQLGILSPEQQEQVRTLANGSTGGTQSNAQATRSTRRARRSQAASSTNSAQPMDVVVEASAVPGEAASE